tara:strand:- start:6694 stop:7107 length:414 start_codon:yes stop_codon:yes gene_type:complete
LTPPEIQEDRGGFWFVTIYDADGWLTRDVSAISDTRTEPKEDHAGSATPQEMNVYQLLSKLGSTSQKDGVGGFMRHIIRTELASDTPAFCPLNGRGRVDAIALRDYALAKASTTSDQRTTTARSVIIGYLVREYPCR